MVVNFLSALVARLSMVTRGVGRVLFRGVMLVVLVLSFISGNALAGVAALGGTPNETDAQL